MKDLSRNIKDSDIVSGSFLNKLINDYKRYDKKQKNLIATLYVDVNNLSKALKEATDKLEIAKELVSKDWKESEAFRKYEALKKNYTVTCKHLYEARQEIITLKQQLSCIQENQ